MDRGIPDGWTPMKAAWSCSARAASGEPRLATPSRRQPRRTASSAADSVSSVAPEQETAITRSAAPTQPGSR